MSEAEFSRPVRVDTLGETPRRIEIEADENERSALARRFGLISIERLAAGLALSRRGDEVTIEGHLDSAVTQTCVVTGDPVPATVEAPFEILFRPQPAPAGPDAEV